MRTDPNSAESRKPPGRFPETRWSLIACAVEGGQADHLKALDELLRIYHPVLKIHAISQFRLPPDQADDMVQSFVLDRILEKKLFQQADRAKGRFRNFLAKVFTRYVLSQLRRARTRKRGPDESHQISLDLNPDQVICASELESQFNEVWARQVLAEALTRMEQECRRNDRPDVWFIFEGRVVKPAIEDTPPLSYEEIIQHCGCVSPIQASNLLITAKRMFARILKEVVGDTVAEPRLVQEEIKALRKIFSSLGAGSTLERRSKG